MKINVNKKECNIVICEYLGPNIYMEALIKNSTMVGMIQLFTMSIEEDKADGFLMGSSFLLFKH